MSYLDEYEGLDFHRVALAISGGLAWQCSMVPERLSETHAADSHRMASKYTVSDAEAVLKRAASAGAEARLRDDELMALLSPAADACLEELARIAQRITRQRFGNTMQLYAPLYLSNTCMSSCTYCGFSFEHDIRRRTLRIEEAVQEARKLHEDGIRHVLLLTGESYRDTPLAYLSEAIREIKAFMPSVAIEVYPLKEKEYRALREVGLDGLAVYQETYDPVRYKEVHLRGMKKRMNYRLECPDRAGKAGVRKIAVGALLGLSDPAADAFFAAHHALYLSRRYWKSHISVSLPRLRPAAGVSGDQIPGISDRDYVRYLCALRLYLPDAGLYLSTRESPEIRDAMSEICITHMSAGSKTEPGGYTLSGSEEQFSIDDTRSVSEVRSALQRRGIEPVLVDWAASLS